ncbi:MAG TPA: hypothetical protein VD963_07180 [Phycisphaerales bacterium]|nr:hypothetical protein [Phycisphaerales bacterium]
MVRRPVLVPLREAALPFQVRPLKRKVGAKLARAVVRVPGRRAGRRVLRGADLKVRVPVRQVRFVGRAGRAAGRRRFDARAVVARRVAGRADRRNVPDVRAALEGECRRVAGLRAGRRLAGPVRLVALRLVAARPTVRLAGDRLGVPRRELVEREVERRVGLVLLGITVFLAWREPMSERPCFQGPAPLRAKLPSRPRHVPGRFPLVT